MNFRTGSAAFAAFGQAALLTLSLSACTPFAGAYSEQAYLNATSLKARSLALVAVSDQPYSSHRDDVAEVLTDIDAAYEYARGLPRNEIVTEQWRLIRDPGAGLVGSFATEWRRRGQFSPAFRDDYAGEIAIAFDTLICVEITRKSATDCSAETGGP